jgi:hypothetical protein
MIIKVLIDMPGFRVDFQVIETKQVNFSLPRSREKKGIKFEGKSAEVVENTCRKNVSFLV